MTVEPSQRCCSPADRTPDFARSAARLRRVTVRAAIGARQRCRQFAKGSEPVLIGVMVECCDLDIARPGQDVASTRRTDRKR